jgi:hypothetical protein
MADAAAGAASCRRLQHLSTVMAAATSAAQAAEHLPPQLELEPGGGGLTPAALTALHDGKAAALAREDYAGAAQFHQTLHCLAARASPPQPPPRDAPAEEHTKFLQDWGFTTIQLFKGDELARLQAAWRRVQAPAEREWAECKLQGVGAETSFVCHFILKK